MSKIEDFIERELKGLDRRFVTTPDNRAYLEALAKGNRGSMDIVLMQLSINYGYKIALENIKDKLENKD